MMNLSIRSALKVAGAGFILVIAASAFGQAGRNSRFDADGSFWIHGDRPNGFSDFGGINLNAKKSRRLPMAGVEIINGKRLPFKTLSVKQTNLSFTTVTLSGISYTFSGKFLKGGVFMSANLDDETPVLEGTLTKYKGGQKVAQGKLSFVYFGGT